MAPGTCRGVLVSKICRLQWCQEPVLSSWLQRSVGYNDARNLSGCPGVKDLSVTMVPGTCLVVLVSKISRLQWCQEPVWLSWWQPNLRFAAAKRTGQNIDIKVLSEATKGGRDSVHCTQSRDTNIDKVCRSYRLSLEKSPTCPVL